MKYIKRFEEKSIHFKPGDYVVIVHPDDDLLKEVLYFLRNNVGVIHSSEYNIYNKENVYNVKYDNVPKELQKHTRYMGSDISELNKLGIKQKGEIFSDFSENIRFATEKEIEIQNMKKTTKKYNI
jgi:hypothetical protein